MLVLTHSLPRVLKLKIFKTNSKFQFVKYLNINWYHVKVLLTRFHLNSHTIGSLTESKVRTTLLSQSITDSGSGRVKSQDAVPKFYQSLTFLCTLAIHWLGTIFKCYMYLLDIYPCLLTSSPCQSFGLVRVLWIMPAYL